MAPDERAAAERAMRKRDRDEALAQGRMRPGLLYGKYGAHGNTPNVSNFYVHRFSKKYYMRIKCVNLLKLLFNTAGVISHGLDCIKKLLCFDFAMVCLYVCMFLFCFVVNTPLMGKLKYF